MAQKRYQDDKRYLVEGKTLNELLEADQTNTLLKGPGYDVSIVPGTGTTLRLASASPLYQPGFWVAWSDSAHDAVTVAPSVVSGMSGASVMPVRGSAPLTDYPPVSVSTVGAVIALRIEADPTVSNIGTVDDPNFVIVDGGGIIDGDVEVVVFPSLEAMNGDALVALIDNSTGDVTQAGRYLIPLAMVMDEGVILQIGHIGPIGVRMCAAGSLVVSSPALQVIAVDPEGNIIPPPAP